MRIWSIQHRPSKPKPWTVRWVVEADPHGKAYRTKAEADRYRSRLLVARHDGEWFDRRTGEPESWAPAADELGLHLWARRWLAEEWQDWAPRTRHSALEALSRFLPLACDPKAPSAPKVLRSYLMTTLPPEVDFDSRDESEKWLGRWTLSLGELSRDILSDIERRLGIGDAGQPLAASTAGRYRRIAHSCVRRGVELYDLPSDPWPSTPKGRSRRKARRKRKAIDVCRLPNPSTMVTIIDAIRSHQPGSRNYQAMTAVTYYGGLRPSEVARLRPRVLHLPDEGWGMVDVVEADDGWDEPAEPKTGDRRVPIPPALVAMLRSWLAEHDFGSDDLLFRTRTGRRPSESNWNRALKRACRTMGHRPLCPYDGRHTCATTWLRAGVPLGEAAARLGHSVETLVSTYVGALEGDDTMANERIEAALAQARKESAQVVGWLLTVCWLFPGRCE